jgi:hypothetical protein
MTSVLNLLRREPAVILYAVNAVVALAVSFGLHLTATQTAAVATIATAVLAIATGALTRPVEVSVISGGLAAGLTAATAFGLHLTGSQIGATVTVLSLVLALILRQNVSPAAAAAAQP